MRWCAVTYLARLLIKLEETATVALQSFEACLEGAVHNIGSYLYVLCKVT